MGYKPDFQEAKKFARNPKEDIVLVENDITLRVMSFATNTMSSFGFRANFFASWKSGLTVLKVSASLCFSFSSEIMHKFHLV